MSSKVEVLCPNGHRVNVKTNVNTTLVQVLEEACNKKGFLPPTDYELKRGTTQKPLDLTLTMRFAGLPNHAKLEMVKASKSRTVSGVTVALQLDSGERPTKECRPEESLWEIVGNAEKQTGKSLTTPPEGLQPVCLYMREEVIGTFALKETTLHSLGLISGRAVIRLMYKAVDKETLEEIEYKITKEKVRRANLTSKGASLFNQEHSTQTTEKPSQEPMDMDNQTDSGPAPVNTNPAAVESEPMETEQKNIADHDLNMELESSNQSCTSGPAGSSGSRPDPSRSRPDSSQPGPDCSIPGVQIFRPGEVNLSPEQELTARQLAEAIMPGVFARRPNPADLQHLREERERRQREETQGGAPQRHRQPPPVNFSKFKFPDETKGKDLYQNELSDAEPDENKPCDRETVLYSTEDIKTSSAVPEEPSEEFFELTDSDVKSLWSDLQRKAVELSDQPLMTQSMRRAQEEARLAKYSRVFIRFTFPDKLVLQGTFRARETVYSLYKFVKDHLEDKAAPFHLYTSPPRKILEDKALTLIQASLVPMTVVYFGSQEKREHYLCSAVLKELSAPMKANQVVISHMPTAGPTDQTRPSTAQGTKRPTAPTVSSNPRSDPPGASKVPKWFKTGK